MRLSRWVKIGIFLSVAWAIGAAVYTHDAAVESANHSAQFSYDVCAYTKRAEHSTDLSSCTAERSKTYATWMESSNTNAVIMALAPIPCAWLAVFILVYVVRAQIAGFRAVVPWKALTRPNKALVVFCCACTALVLLGCIVTLLNGYVDRKVPVGIAGLMDFQKTGNDFLTVTGTWTRTDLTDDSIAAPLQTSKIECDRATNQCLEAVASVSETTLMTDLVRYDIQSWTPDAIVLRKDDLCATEVFTIDLNTKAVTGAGHKTNEKTEYCAPNPLSGAGKESWTYELANGFKVYWGLRQQARPMPLRVFESLFGN